MWQYKASNFSSPPTPYEVGDIIIFHCLTQHEANPHTVKDSSDGAGNTAPTAAEEGGQIEGEQMDPYRVSMDGRFLMELWR
jgi:hypothetical protein